MNRRAPSLIRPWAVCALGLAILMPGAAHADALTGYRVQVIARLGDKVGSSALQGGLSVGQLNDRGQLAFQAGLDGAGAVLQYSNGQISPIAKAGQMAPDGQTWPKDTGFFGPVSMNQSGDIAIVPAVAPGTPLGTYRWDQQTQSLIPVAVPGTPAGSGLTFTNGADNGGAELSDQDETLFLGAVKDANGQASTGFFLGDKNGQIRKVVLPGDPLPGQNGNVVSASVSVGFLNTAGQVAFSVQSTRDPKHLSTFLWENGTVSTIADADTVIPGFGKVVSAFTLMANNKKSSVVMGANIANGGPRGIFLWDNGQFTPIILPGQEMPGGGQYRGEGPQPYDWGWASAAGEYPFLLQVTEGGVTKTAAYRIGPDGKLSLIAKTGMTTDLGTITAIDTNNSNGIALNARGQVVLAAQIDNGPDALLLLTPTGQ